MRSADNTKNTAGWGNLGAALGNRRGGRWRQRQRVKQWGIFKQINIEKQIKRLILRERGEGEGVGRYTVNKTDRCKTDQQLESIYRWFVRFLSQKIKLHSVVTLVHLKLMAIHRLEHFILVTLCILPFCTVSCSVLNCSHIQLWVKSRVQTIRVYRYHIDIIKQEQNYFRGTVK